MKKRSNFNAKSGSSPLANSRAVWTFIGHMAGNGYAVGMVKGWSLSKYRCGLAEKEVLIEIGERRRTKSVGYFHRDSAEEFPTEEALEEVFPGIFENDQAEKRRQ